MGIFDVRPVKDEFPRTGVQVPSGPQVSTPSAGVLFSQWADRRQKGWAQSAELKAAADRQQAEINAQGFQQGVAQAGENIRQSQTIKAQKDRDAAYQGFQQTQQESGFAHDEKMEQQRAAAEMTRMAKQAGLDKEVEADRRKYNEEMTQKTRQNEVNYKNTLNLTEPYKSAATFAATGAAAKKNQLDNLYAQKASYASIVTQAAQQEFNQRFLNKAVDMWQGQGSDVSKGMVTGVMSKLQDQAVGTQVAQAINPSKIAQGIRDAANNGQMAGGWTPDTWRNFLTTYTDMPAADAAKIWNPFFQDMNTTHGETQNKNFQDTLALSRGESPKPDTGLPSGVNRAVLARLADPAIYSASHQLRQEVKDGKHPNDGVAITTSLDNLDKMWNWARDRHFQMQGQADASHDLDMQSVRDGSFKDTLAAVGSGDPSLIKDTYGRNLVDLDKKIAQAEAEYKELQSVVSDLSQLPVEITEDPDFLAHNDVIEHGYILGGEDGAKAVKAGSDALRTKVFPKYEARRKAAMQKVQQIMGGNPPTLAPVAPPSPAPPVAPVTPVAPVAPGTPGGPVESPAPQAPPVPEDEWKNPMNNPQGSMF